MDIAIQMYPGNFSVKGFFNFYVDKILLYEFSFFILIPNFELFEYALDCLFYVLHIFDQCMDLICFGAFVVP